MFSKLVTAIVVISAGAGVMAAPDSLFARQSDCLSCLSSVTVTVAGVIGPLSIPFPNTCVAPGATCGAPFTTVSESSGIVSLDVVSGVRK